jgi:Outer membrane protein beta-barrel domain
MENEFYNEQDLEQFLQEQVQKHRMYPNDSLWNGIYNELQGHRRWPGLMVVAVFIVAALTLGTLFTKQPTTRNYSETIPSQQVVTTTASIEKSGGEINDDYFSKTNSAEKNTAHFIATVKEELDNNQAGLGANAIAISNASLPLANNTIANNEKKLSSEPSTTLKDIAIVKGNGKKATSNEDELSGKEEDLKEEKVMLNAEGATLNTSITAALPTKIEKQKKSITEAENNDKYSNVDDYLNQLGYNKADYKKPKVSRWESQFYITPSLSYRKLIDESAKQNASNPIVANHADDANKVARYKPGNGIEVGAALLYKIAKNVKLKVGLQYNLRQYSIDAYAGNYEQATLVLNNNGILDSINSVAVYRSGYGYMPATLNNKIQSLSVPIGIEVNVLNTKKVGIAIAASVQPTYNYINSKYYLLSYNYKNYTDGSQFFREWNLNSSIEGMFTYKIGNYKWMMGPQLRYQHLPTFIRNYPIKEHLIDYGIKIGFTKTIH